MMQTKAELEAEINDLKVRVAELEGACAAYQYALAHKPVEPLPFYPNTDQWQWTFPNVVTTPVGFPNTATYNFGTE